MFVRKLNLKINLPIMKKILIALVFILAASTVVTAVSSAQSLYFCEGVDSDGYPINESSTFNISRDGGYLYVLTRLPYRVDCRSVSIVIYRNNEYDNTIYVDTERDWVWFWKQITFYKSGDYDIYVYDCNDYLLTSGYLRINYN
ncbi:MAG: hypothetical protein UZ04_CHB001000231 [Chlorobi bacterium OLB4]|jgi:hypothetical protein|nr:MAG: hypothetical protein EDM69_07015 [Chlorobiota bacterium]KXK06229.1 MAG: hypothetical protein UZ04_CHB001000231 [Chlorobi bacterium OLB4]MBV6399258.1 hypothetical protein [Ignavibacteria bacterium]MCE7953539.1 hypothetical protein [Chlorobi bacterium CHB7]OQY78456.1 MAG: hypothetical protein B6D43_03020 [Ignavibacteriales bacterium UTCHB1]RIK49273.1 MAG: hypothetical protein DCC60_04800 [Ignavibacteriota bacterium]